MKNLSKILFGTGFLIWLFSFYLYLRMNGVKDGIPILQSPSDNLINESVSVTKFVFALTQIVLRILVIFIYYFIYWVGKIKKAI